MQRPALVDPRARRLAIREHLSSARGALERGDRAAARLSVQAALSLDPDYLASRTMLELVEEGAWPRELSVRPPTGTPETAGSAPPDTLISEEGWARFEHRARLRRVEKRAAAARRALARGRYDLARGIMAEIRAIDAAHPELVSLAIELDASEHLPSRPFGLLPLVAGLAVFTVLVLWTVVAPTPQSPGIVAGGDAQRSALTIGPASVPSAVAMPAATQAVPDLPSQPPPEDRPRSGESTPRPLSIRPVVTVSPRDETPPARRAPTRPFVWPPVSEPAPNAAASTPADPVVVAPGVSQAALPTAPGPDPPVAATPVLASAERSGTTSRRVAPDDELVRRTLQQYRLAYEALDARAAQAVWPAVDGAALQRAFDGLQSQRITFDDCRVQLNGVAGSAVCRGVTRYVPRIGSREPRVEPRVWTFAVRKAGEAWQIEQARAER